jgi:hypothetical protein
MTDKKIDIDDAAARKAVWIMYQPTPGLRGAITAVSSTGPHKVTEAKSWSFDWQALHRLLSRNASNFHEKSNHPQMTLAIITSGK